MKVRIRFSRQTHSNLITTELLSTFRLVCGFKIQETFRKPSRIPQVRLASEIADTSNCLRLLCSVSNARKSNKISTVEEKPTDKKAQLQSTVGGNEVEFVVLRFSTVRFTLNSSRTRCSAFPDCSNSLMWLTTQRVINDRQLAPWTNYAETTRLSTGARLQ